MSSSQSELTTLSAVQLADKIRARDVSAREVADAFWRVLRLGRAGACVHHGDGRGCAQGS
jgi:hypothetical protein